MDVTKNRINSLSNETLKILSSLDKKVNIICVPSQNPMDSYCDGVSSIIQLYVKNSPEISYAGRLDLADRISLQRIQPSGFSRLVLLSPTNKSEVVDEITESKLTNAIVNLVKYKKTVYFLTGHGEPSINVGASGKNYADVVSALEAKSYEVKPWPISNGAFPSGARVVVVGDNQLAYDGSVNEMLLSFVAKGGKVLAIVNPYRETGLDKFLSVLGVKLPPILLTLNPDTPLGRQLAKQSVLRPPVVINNFSYSSPITKVIGQVYGAQAVVPVDGGRPLEFSQQSSSGKPEIHSTVLMTAFSAAPITISAEKRNRIDLAKLFSMMPDKNFDPSKEWAMGLDLTINQASFLQKNVQIKDKSKDNSEVVIYGFSLVNPYSRSSGVTEELIPLTIAHLYQDEELVSIPARDLGPKKLNLALNPGAWALLFAGILPVVTAIIGVFFWLKRRAA